MCNEFDCVDFINDTLDFCFWSTPNLSFWCPWNGDIDKISDEMLTRNVKQNWNWGPELRFEI